MGQTLTTIVTYPFRATFNVAVGTNPDSDVNITDSNIREFNSKFADYEEKINDLINKLYNNENSSIKTFNTNILFPYTHLLADNLLNHGNADSTGEFSMDRSRFILILEKIMLLYSTDKIGYTPCTDSNFSKYFEKSHGIIKNKLNKISTTYNNIQPFLNDNSNVDEDEFKEKINNKFNQKFLEENSIIQYLNLLKNITEKFIDQLNTEIKIFKQEKRTDLQNLYDYTVGFFSWLGRSGYTYKGTANFYTYYRDHNIILLKNRIDNKIQSLKNSIETLKLIKSNHETLDYHIKKNINDKFVITFHVDQNNYDISIKLNNYLIESYANLCELIKTEVNKKLKEKHPNVSNITFNIVYYEKDDERFKNNILIICNQKFTLKKNSSIMKILGWNSYIDIESMNQLNKNNDKIGNFIISHNKNFHDNIQNIINYSSRHNAIITAVETFDTSMDIQRTQENN